LKASEKRCLEGETINDCECEHLRREFLSLREKYQLMHSRAYKDYRVGIEEAIFFGYVDLKRLPVGFESRLHFESRLAFGLDDICNLFADLMQRTLC
jgi:hypothetical protein